MPRSCTMCVHSVRSFQTKQSAWKSVQAFMSYSSHYVFKCACHAKQWQNTYCNPPYLSKSVSQSCSCKFLHVISAARFTPPPQYIHQNVRLGREWGAITFLSDPRYHCDVIRKKRRPKPPLT